VDFAWEKYKLEARKLLENGDDSPLSNAIASKPPPIIANLLIIGILRIEIDWTPFSSKQTCHPKEMRRFHYFIRLSCYGIISPS
jgi:hypothetical protein